MKFSHTLREVTGIYSQYVAYRVLKKLVRQIQLAGPSKVDQEISAQQLWWFDSTAKTSFSNISVEEVSFIRNLESEISRVKRLHQSKLNELYDQLTDVFKRIHGGFNRDMLESDLDSIAHQLVALERYIRQSKVLCYKILKKHDKRTPLQVGSWMLARLEQEPFWTANFDAVVVGLSDAYAEVRSFSQSGKKREAVKDDEDVETFERHTSKYFIKPEDIMFIKTSILKHLPLDIFGRKKDPLVEYSSYLESIKSVRDATVVNSIYLDNEDLDMYYNRMGVEERRKGNLIRVRWYGDHVNPATFLYVERKTRRPHGEFTIDEAVKERFRIKETNMQGYMSGEWNISKKLENMLARQKIQKETAEQLWETSNGIQQEILEKRLSSAIRTVCRRSAFQVGKDQSLRLSLDTNLHMIDETDEHDSWFRDMEKRLNLSEVVKFPFAILEIKTQTDAPEWIEELRNSGVLIEADRFSKFLYGCVKFRQDVRHRPPWYSRVTDLECVPPITRKLTSILELRSHASSPATPGTPGSPATVVPSRSAGPSSTLSTSDLFDPLSSSNTPATERTSPEAGVPIRSIANLDQVSHLLEQTVLPECEQQQQQQLLIQEQQEQIQKQQKLLQQHSPTVVIPSSFGETFVAANLALFFVLLFSIARFQGVEVGASSLLAILITLASVFVADTERRIQRALLEATLRSFVKLRRSMSQTMHVPIGTVLLGQAVVALVIFYFAALR